MLDLGRAQQGPSFPQAILSEGQWCLCRQVLMLPGQGAGQKTHQWGFARSISGCSCDEGHWRDLICKVLADGCGAGSRLLLSKIKLACHDSSAEGFWHWHPPQSESHVHRLHSRSDQPTRTSAHEALQCLPRGIWAQTSAAIPGARTQVTLPAVALITCYCTKAGGLPGSYLGSSKSALQLGHVQMTRFPMIRPT